MRNRNRFFLIATIGLVALSAFAYSRIEWVEKVVDRGYSEDAMKNRYLAAELFLQSRGIETETVVGLSLLDALPPTRDMLLLSASRESLSERRRQALVDWVRSGGTLMVVAHSLYDEEIEGSADQLLDDLGVYLIELESEEDDFEAAATEDGEEESPSSEDEAAEEEKADSDESAWAPETLGDLFEALETQEECETDLDRTSLYSQGESTEVRLELDSEQELAVVQEELEIAHFSDDGQVLRLPVHDGLVIALTSVGPFQNRRIQCHDHAFFLWSMARDRDKIWLLHDPDVASLSRLAWRAFPLSLAGGIALLLLIAARASLRFGVPTHQESVARREIRESLEARVTFLFRKGGFAALFERLRSDLAQRSPGDASKWALRAGLPEDAAQAALTADPPTARREIVRRIQMMLRLRRTK